MMGHYASEMSAEAVLEFLAGEEPMKRESCPRCGAPIPRLEGPACVADFNGTPCGWTLAQHPRRAWYCSAYLGPLASECTRGHPVAVPAEEPAP